jgi:hypothetical protein
MVPSYRIERKGYVFLFDGKNTAPIQRRFAELTQTPGSNFTWHDAAVVSSKMREIQRQIDGRELIHYRVIFYREFPERTSITNFEIHLTGDKHRTWNEILDKHKATLTAGWYVDVSVISEATSLQIEADHTKFFDALAKAGV